MESISKSKNPMVLILPGSFLAGLLTYLVLSYLYTPVRISVLLSILISTLIFGLNKYYFLSPSDTNQNTKIHQYKIEYTSYVGQSSVFILIYGILFLMLILTSISEQGDPKLYIPWEQVTLFDVLNLANAIAFSFFIPGYGLVVVLDKKGVLSLPLKLLLSYLISILLVAVPSYAGASFGYLRSDIEVFTISSYAVIFVLLVLDRLKRGNAGFYNIMSRPHRASLSLLYSTLTNRSSEFAIFASLFALVVFYTYYLNDGVIVVDQWFHHGRALLIGSQLYKDIASAEFYIDPYTDFGSDVTQIYPPIFSSLLAGFFDLSNSPSVNAYVSIGFLNAMPVFAFYYFFTRWVPKNKKRAALLATTLFVLSSGFGWIYAVDLALVSHPSNEKQAIDIFADVTNTAYDIGLPTTFINVGHPDITTPLIIIALPAGFTILGMIKEIVVKEREGEGLSIVNTDVSKYRMFVATISRGRLGLLILKKSTGTTTKISLLITMISFLGILSHDEFYLFIIIACVTIIVLMARPLAKQSFQQSKGISRNTMVYGYSIFFSSFLASMFLVAFIDTFVSPIRYYITREIGGIPLIFLGFIFVSSTWVIYTVIYMASRRRNISFIHVKNSASSNNDNTELRGVNTGRLRKILDYATSKMKEISESSKIKNLISISNSSSPDTSSGGSAASLRVYRIIRLALPISTVSVIVFLYLFTFLVWSQLPNEDIRSQVDTENQWNVPWYLYPMKFGLTGLLGLAFILSYLFKKFEKEIFVFAIVAILALLAGPYYDEHRFGKYIMTGMASFAALLIYGIISKFFSNSSFLPLRFYSVLGISVHLGTKFKMISSGLLMGLVITFSGLSIFMFAGFVELVTNVADFNEGTRRDFPTHSEMQLLDFLHARLIAQNPDNYYNIALPDKEVDNNRGFLTKIYGFTPIPRAKLLQTPLVLNASTIETFYNLLDYGGTKFIVIPKKDLSGDILSMSNNYQTDNIIHFALENFRKVFEDDNYVVLDVPTLSPPSPKGDVALIYPKNELFSSSLISENGNDNKNNTITKLPFNTIWFKEIDNLKEFVKGENERSTAVLYGDKEQRIVLWSDPLELQQQSSVNYIEATFRIIGENKTSNDAGISWDIGNKEYTVSVRNDRLEILEKPTDVSNRGESLDSKLINVREIKRENGIWYTLKIIIADNIVNIYVNDLLAAQVPMESYLSNSEISQQLDGSSFTNASANASIDSRTGNSKATPITGYNISISRVGLFSLNNVAEFKPIKLGKILFESDKKEETYYQHYYPLSMLALSKIDYNTYIEGDLSAFSKKYVILPFDPLIIDSNLSSPSSAGSRYIGEKVDDSIYLDYVRNGGNLIVIDSSDYGKDDIKKRDMGIFSRLLSLSPTGNYSLFDGISDAASLQNTKSVTSKKNPNNLEEQEQMAQNVKGNYGNTINISGIVEKTLYNSSNIDNISVKSYYTIEKKNNNKTETTIVAPFIIEKKYGNGIVTYVNAHGYFHTIFSGLSSINNSNNNNTYHSNNEDRYFSTLANITSIIDPDGQFSNRNFLNAAASTSGSLGATKIRQILDNIQISSGYATRINSSSLLLSISDNSNGDLAAKDVTFISSSSLSRSTPFSVTNLSNKNVTTATNDSRYADMADRTLQSNNESDEDSNSNYKYSFKNAKIRNLKMYGSYEVIVESNAGNKLLLPMFPSFSDYVAMSLHNGFDMTIKLSDSKPSYAEFEIIEDNDDGAAKVNGTFQRLRIYGDDIMNSSGTNRGLGLANIKSNEIHFHKTHSDLADNGFTSLLMKSPQFQVKKEGARTTGMQSDYAENRSQENVNSILTFKRDSPEAEPIEIMNEVGSKESVIFRIDYVDSYNQPYREGIKNHYLTYIEEDIKVIQNDINKDDIENDPSTVYQYSTNTPDTDIKLPGDISERAKRQGVGVQWQETMTSDSGLLLAILIIITSIITTKIATKMNSWPKPKSS